MASHLKITQQISQSCSSGVRQLYGLQIANATDTFMAIDRDKDGELSVAEIFQGLKRLGGSLSESQVAAWIASLDIDESGHIDAVEFIVAIDQCTKDQALRKIAEYKPTRVNRSSIVQHLPEKSTSKSAGKHVVKKIRTVLKKGKLMVKGYRIRDAVSLFNAIDVDFSATVDKHEIATTLKALHIGVSDHDIKTWLRSMDGDGSGNVDPDEFLEAIVGRPPTEEELSRIKGGPGVDSRGNKRTDNLKKGKSTSKKIQNEALTTQILLCLDTKRKRSVYGFFVTDAHSLFHALDRDSSGAIDRDELIRGLKRMGVHASMKAMNQWVDHLDMNDDGKFWLCVGAGGRSMSTLCQVSNTFVFVCRCSILPRRNIKTNLH